MKVISSNSIDADVNAAILSGLREYNSQFALPDHKEFQVSVRESEIILGGASGKSYWDWLFVNYLWVDSKTRGRGIGSMLMAEIQKIAIERRCMGIHLDTFSFQAHDFYVKNGYRVFGTVDNHPKGHKRYFMSKYIGQSVVE